MKFAKTVPLMIMWASVAFAAQMPDTEEYTNSIGMKFVHIEPGTFQMGVGKMPLPRRLNHPKERSGNREIYIPTKNGDYDERPVHQVTISNPFYMAIHEVTNEQYEKFDPLHVYLRGKLGFSIDNDEAVVFITWHEAKAFCDWLSQKEGLPYRLPTEAEWEYACRAGTTTHFHTGDTLPDVYLKNPGNSWYPDPENGRGREEVVPLHVGKTPPNPWGLYDMHGNVEEWCSDWYGPYEAQPQTDPVGRIDGDFKVTRGGSHATFAYYLRAANRMGTVPENKTWLIGFRVVLAEPSQTPPLPVPPKPLHQQYVKQVVPPNLTKAPNPQKPYFKGPHNYVKVPPNSLGPLFSRHNHNSAVVECPNGDLLATWFTTCSEPGREMALAASRLPYGRNNWQPASPFWDAPDRNDPAHALWYDRAGTIYHFSSISVAATWGPLAVVMRTSADSGATWSKPRLIIPDHGRRHQVIESVFQTREGYLVLPCDATPAGGGGTALHISRGRGLTWTDPGGTIAGIHAAVTQLSDARLLAFGRGDTINNKMPLSLSSDMGKTWTYSPSIFPPIGGGQRLVLLRLKQGPLFLASFANEPITITDASGKKRPVTGLFAALSYDDGKTWPRIRLITDDGPERQMQTTNGKPFTMSVSSAEPRGYLSVCQGANGLIHLTSSWNHYAFNLKWLQTPAPACGTHSRP
ncbi:MAG: SUMF1/EgtB/PvdO family nonheme iron enzyme [Planctomycetota bacterium]|jgi:formylglycine-generating enzyme required for sulfatase activity